MGDGADIKAHEDPVIASLPANCAGQIARGLSTSRLRGRSGMKGTVACTGQRALYRAVYRAEAYTGQRLFTTECVGK